MRNPDIDSLISRIRDSHEKHLSVGPGWIDLIISCDKELQKIDPDYTILQVKEKYGGLRFYYASSEGASTEQGDAMNKVVEKYERIASVTCEETGKDGVLMKSIGGWFKTLNPEYAESKHSHARYSPVEQRLIGGDE